MFLCINIRDTVMLGSALIIILSPTVTLCGEVTDCPLWQVKHGEKCECVSSFKAALVCKKDTLLVQDFFCITWDNDTNSARVSYCLFTPINISSCREGHYNVSTKLSGQQLNKWMCGKLNRQGTQCKECISGYGPAVFSDGISCADCSQHRYMWILNLLLQLLCVTIMFVVIMLLKIKGSSCPWNIIITYSQLTVNAVVYDIHLRNQMLCFVGEKAIIAILTILGVSNLDFFQMVIPPLCVSTSMKAIDTLFFDYIVALYPVLITVVLYLLIELHDHDCCVIVVLSLPLRRINHIFRGNLKQNIISTFATFLLLSYSKLLFVSCKFLFAVQSYNSSGDPIPNSTVLLYDPTITFFKIDHIPYIIVALFVIATFILLPPFLLLTYLSRFFRKLFTFCGFQRWGILQMIMDAFQGWYKDGTEGTRDYRPVSAFFMLLKIALMGEFLTVIQLSLQSEDGKKWIVTGVVHVLLGIFHLTTKPYKKRWMNNVDGSLLMLIGSIVILVFYIL